MFLFVSSGVSTLAMDIHTGNLDKILLKPLKPWMMIFLNGSWWMEGLVIFVPSVMILFISMLYLNFNWNVLSVFYVLVIFIQSIILLLLFNIAVAFLSFFWNKFTAINTLLMNVYAFTRYPSKIYPSVVQCLFSSFVPVLFIASPIYLVFENNYGVNDIRNSTILISVFFVAVVFLYVFGLKKYNSAS